MCIEGLLWCFCGWRGRLSTDGRTWDGRATNTLGLLVIISSQTLIFSYGLAINSALFVW